MLRRSVVRANAPEPRAHGAARPTDSLIADRPVAAAEFAACLGSLASFGRAPRIAVAVSGGCDSMALALLAHAWAGAQGGTVLALIVDHGLRAGSTAEAVQTRIRLARLGIAAEILTWTDDRPSTRIEESARDARYRLLIGRCRQTGIVDLLTAHQADDQAETVAMRLARGSSLEGLAGISARVEQGGVRILRPLLEFPRARLAATLTAAKLDWIEDPSNDDMGFERNRWRAAMTPELTGNLRALARRFGQERAAVERQLAKWLDRHVKLAADGHARVDAVAFAALPKEIAVRILGRLADSVGGRFYPSRKSVLRQALGQLAAGKSTAAGGCLFRQGKNQLLVLREFAAIGAASQVVGGEIRAWDGRFKVTAPHAGWLGPLGPEGWAGAKAQIKEAGLSPPIVPAACAWTLPALWSDMAGNGRKLLAIPDLLLLKDYGLGAVGPARVSAVETRFAPRHALTPAPFALVLPVAAPIY